MSKVNTFVRLISVATLFCGSAEANSKFPLMKQGEWKVETLSSSLGPFSQSIKATPFCIDKAMDEKAWEERAKKEMAKSGLDCGLTQSKQNQKELSYQIQCKALPPEPGKKSFLAADAVLKGQVTLSHISETEYIMDHVASGTGLQIPSLDTEKMSPAQRQVMDALLGGKNSAIQMQLKQRYVFVQAACTKK